MKRKIRVTVKFVPNFLKRELLGEREVPNEIFISEEGSMKDLIEELDKISGGRFKENILREGEIRDDIIVLLNGRGIARESLESVKVKSGDEIVFLPMIDGG